MENKQEEKKLRLRKELPMEYKSITVNGKIIKYKPNTREYLKWMPVLIDNELLLIYGREQGLDKKYEEETGRTIDDYDYISIYDFAHFVQLEIELTIKPTTAQIIEEMQNTHISQITSKHETMRLEAIENKRKYELLDNDMFITMFERDTVYSYIERFCIIRLTQEEIKKLRIKYKHLIEIKDDTFREHYFKDC